MRSKVKLFGSLVLLLVFVTSCGSKFSLQKRRYTKGFYFVAHKNKEVKKFSAIASVENKTADLEFIKEVKAVSITPSNETEFEKNIENADLKKAKRNSLKERYFHKFISQKSESKETANKKKEDIKSSQSLVKKRPDALDILNSISVGYYVITILVCLVAGAWYLFTYYPLEQALIIVAAIVLVLLVCYWVGSLFTR